MIDKMADPSQIPGDAEASHGGRHRTIPVALANGFAPAADDVEARLLGQPRSMRSREVSA